MMKSIISAAGLFAAAVSAYTPPNGPNPTYGALITPNGDVPVVTGQTIDITWSPKQPTTGVTVSLVLCNGPSTNCVRQSSAIVEGVQASAAKYSWNVPCDLPLGTANTASGYGMLIIVDGTGEYQYSTQFSVLKGASCGAVTTSSSISTTTTSSSSRSSTISSSGSVSSSSSSRPTSSVSTSVTYTDNYSSWLQWSGSVTSTSTLIRSTTAVPVVTTSAAPAPATTSAAATTTSARPSVYTGAAAMPTAFVNIFAAVGAAGLAVYAL